MECPFASWKGYCFGIALMSMAGKEHHTIKYAIRAWSPNTIKSYNTGWKRLLTFMFEQEGFEHSFDSEESIRKLMEEFITWLIRENDERCSPSAVDITKSSVVSLFGLAFNINSKFFSDAKIITQMLKGHRRMHPKLPRYLESWDISLFIDYCRNNFESEAGYPDFYECLQNRTIGIIAVFTFLRPVEIANLSFQGSREVTEGLYLTTLIKTEYARAAAVFIPKLSDDKISPYYWVTALRKKVLETNPKATSLFMTQSGQFKCSTYQIRKALNNILIKLGLGNIYTAYSFKHAAMSYLVKQNVPAAQIEEACRYKFVMRQSMLAQFYAVTEASLKIPRILAEAYLKNSTPNNPLPNPSPEEEELKDIKSLEKYYNKLDDLYIQEEFDLPRRLNIDPPTEEVSASYKDKETGKWILN
jgi:integrase